MVAVLPLRPLGMDLAIADVWETATNAGRVKRPVMIAAKS